MNKHLMIITGEPSGDLHGSNLAKSLLSIDRNLRLTGIGGHLMREADVRTFQDIDKLAVVGLFEVFKKLSSIKEIFRDTVKKLDSDRPEGLILIDYPGFNLRLACQAKKRKISVIYYISPQIWAWGASRIKAIKKYVDKMIVLFKFEELLYRQNDIDATFVGHPLLDTARASLSKEAFLKKYNLKENIPTIGLLPGSRESEINYNLPIMLSTAQILQRQTEREFQFCIPKVVPLSTSIFEHIIARFDIKPNIIENDIYNCINACDILLVASGTATLETAIIGRPFIVIYKVSFLTWLFAKLMIRIPYVGLVNVVAGKKVVPEFIQYGARPKEIANQITYFLKDEKMVSKMKDDLSLVRRSLGEQGASERAAREILKFLENTGLGG